MKSARFLVGFLCVLGVFMILFGTARKPANVPPAQAGEVIHVELSKPKDVVRKSDNLKIMGDIDGLVAGKSYVIRIQVYENGGSGYSAPTFPNFSVVD